MISRVLCCLALLTLLAACASVRPQSTDPAASVDTIDPEIEALRREQIQLLAQWDTAATHGQSQCKTLCQDHTRICAIADRICAIADKHPDHPRAIAACRQANQTCANVTSRLPQECWCR